MGPTGSPLLHPGQTVVLGGSILQVPAKGLPMQSRDRAPKADHQGCSRLLRATPDKQALQGRPAVAGSGRGDLEAAACQSCRCLMLRFQRKTCGEMLLAIAALSRSL